MTSTDTLVRQVDNTIKLFVDAKRGPDRQRIRERLEGMAAELRSMRDEREQEVAKRYDELTPDRQEKFPDVYEKKFERWEAVLTEYERICLAIWRADSALHYGIDEGKVA